LNKIANKYIHLLDWVLIIILAIIWGSSFILIKKGLDTYTPLQVGTIRMSFAFLTMLGFSVRNLGLIKARRWVYIIIIGLIGNLIPAYLFSLAETQIESSLAGILNALTPIFTFIIATMFFSHKMKLVQVGGLLLAFSGAIGLSFIGKDGGLGAMNIYTWLVVIATLMYAISLNIVKKKFPDVGAIELTSLAMFAIGPPAMLILFSTDFVSRVGSGKPAIESLLYLAVLGIIGTAFALTLYNKLIKISTTIFASSVTYLIPFVAVLWGIVDGERLYPLHFAGMFITIAGIYIVSRSK